MHLEPGALPVIQFGFAGDDDPTIEISGRNRHEQDLHLVSPKGQEVWLHVVDLDCEGFLLERWKEHNPPSNANYNYDPLRYMDRLQKVGWVGGCPESYQEKTEVTVNGVAIWARIVTI